MNIFWLKHNEWIKNSRQKQLIYNLDNETTIEMVNSQYVNSNRSEFAKKIVNLKSIRETDSKLKVYSRKLSEFAKTIANSKWTRETDREFNVKSQKIVNRK